MKESNKKKIRKAVRVLLRICYDLLIGVIVYLICKQF